MERCEDAISVTDHSVPINGGVSVCVCLPHVYVYIRTHLMAHRLQ